MRKPKGENNRNEEMRQKSEKKGIRKTKINQKVNYNWKENRPKEENHIVKYNKNTKKKVKQLKQHSET